MARLQIVHADSSHHAPPRSWRQLAHDRVPRLDLRLGGVVVKTEVHALGVRLDALGA